MKEFITLLASLAICARILGGLVVWTDDRPTSDTWLWRAVWTLAGVASVALLIWIHRRRRDLVPDFSSQHVNRFLDCAGFSFSVAAIVENGVFMVKVLFQNQFERPCVAHVALRPVAGAFRSAVKLFHRDEFAPLTFEIQCGPAAFGMSSIPLPVPADRAGKNLVYQLGATAIYPQGKGKRLRFRSGVPIRYNADFHSSLHATLQVLYMLGGGILFSSPASITFRLPSGVAESIPAGLGQNTETLWILDQNSNDSVP